MTLTVVRQTYDPWAAAELAYTKKPTLLRYIREQLRTRRVIDSYALLIMEDILHSGIELLLSTRFECANADEAISEAMRSAVQATLRTIGNSNRREVSSTLSIEDGKDGAREVSRFDLNGGSTSAEDVVFQQEDACSLGVAVERAECVRYAYGFDVLLALLLRAGTSKGLWSEAKANGLLSAFGSASPQRHYTGDDSIARVVSAANSADTEELLDVMRRNLPRCELLFSSLGCAA
ncbi:hypothetical protein FACS1894208_02180 [Clostridia bacterium]|nr:hypothetical protein FACS1894208_02180 [Clostridia bacterium]